MGLLDEVAVTEGRASCLLDHALCLGRGFSFRSCYSLVDAKRDAPLTAKAQPHFEQPPSSSNRAPTRASPSSSNRATPRPPAARVGKLKCKQSNTCTSPLNSVGWIPPTPDRITRMHSPSMTELLPCTRLLARLISLRADREWRGKLCATLCGPDRSEQAGKGQSGALFTKRMQRGRFKDFSELDGGEG